MTLALKCLAPRPMAELRLICFTHAGAGVSIYRAWAQMLPPTIELYGVQLPGREEAMAQAPYQHWDELAADLSALARTLPHGKIALYGHSLGAVLALELARCIGATMPEKLQHLFCAARSWPGDKASTIGDIDALNDEGLLKYMDENYGGAGGTMDNADIRALFLPILRQDLALLTTYQWQDAPRLLCPITVYAGADDPLSAHTDFSSWQNETANEFTFKVFPADHLFHMTFKEELLADITEQLGR